jgi:hypothetical protein
MTEIPAPLPFHVSVQGAKVCISVRDAFHLERERDFKRQIRLAPSGPQSPLLGLQPHASAAEGSLPIRSRGSALVCQLRA